jgi:hypothetical protein
MLYVLDDRRTALPCDVCAVQNDKRWFNALVQTMKRPAQKDSCACNAEDNEGVVDGKANRKKTEKSAVRYTRKIRGLVESSCIMLEVVVLYVLY